MNVVTRREAKIMGLKRLFTGVPCIMGMQCGVHAMGYIALIACCLLSVGIAQAQTIVAPGPSQGFMPGAYPAGRVFGSELTVMPTSNAISAANRIFATPFYMRAGSVVKTLSFNVTAANASPWHGEVCLYADTGSGLPGALLLDSGSIAVGATVTGMQTFTLSPALTLGAGTIWLSFITDSAAESVSSLGNASVGPLSSATIIGWASLANASAATNTTGVFAAQTFGTCPATFPAATYGDGAAIPYIYVGF